MSRTSEAPPAPTTSPAPPGRRPRLTAIDAARGVALIGMIAVHTLPAYDPVTFEPTLAWELFAGRAAALFALLAGLSLAFSSGGRSPHRGRALAATRAGLVVRAMLIAAVGLAINEAMPSPAPAQGILVYYGLFFLLAIPLLGLRTRTLAAGAALFAVLGPVLVHVVGPVLPRPTTGNPTLGSVVADPGATLAQLLLTGTYPAVPYLTFICAGVLLGRLDLHDAMVRAWIVISGVLLAAGSWFAYWALVLQTGGYQHLMRHTPWLSEQQIDEIIVWGPDPVLPTTTWWWLLTPGPHSSTPVTLLMDLGTALVAVGVLLLIVRPNRFWNALGAMGARTLTLYSAHLLVLAALVHYEQPALWFLVHVLAAVVFALLWQKHLGQGPLERGVAAAVRGTRHLVLGAPARTADTATRR